MGAETLLVRLKPHDPRRGFVLRRFVFGNVRFEVGRGWYRVDHDVADYLRTVKQVVTDPHSPLAFDVCNEEEAAKLDADADSADRAARASDPIRVPSQRDAGTAAVEPGVRRQRKE